MVRAGTNAHLSIFLNRAAELYPDLKQIIDILNEFNKSTNKYDYLSKNAGWLYLKK